jgi:type IV pilus assembly protein PilY1
MVRDIWQDENGDRVKQAGEFHTVAILSERSGGSQFVALDVTNPLQPVFRWTFPQLCSTEQNLVGQSWTDFSPRPPPIGPVKIALPNGQRDALGRNFEERWVAMLNGGYDPAGTRGRGVWMVDAWTGNVLWRFADVDFQAMFPSGTPAGMYPVAASPGMVDIGDAHQAILDSDGYFDTATWGDMGGQLWVARFKEPGVLVNGRVSNWFASRAFEELRRTDDNQVFWQLQPDGVTKQFRNEFYRMTSNIWEPNTATLRSFLGSGNRERLLTVGPTCGPTNFLGCAQSGCGVVKLTNTTQVGACTIVSKFLDNNNQFQHNSVTMSGCGTEPLDCSGGVKVRIDMNLNNCPGVQNPPDVSGTLTCGSDGTCSDRTKVGKTRDLSTKTWPALTNHNRFYGIWAYSSDRAFNSAATAVTFDQRRFTDVAYPAVCNGTAGNACTLVNTTYATVATSGAVTCTSGTTCSATTADPGWFYEYGRQCPLGTCSSTPPWTDEKTGSGATVIGSCVDWNTIRPMGAAVGGTPCTAGSGLPENYTYLADGITGVPDNRYCGFPSVANNLIYRATSRRSIAPPLDPTGVITVSSTGGVRQSALQIEPGTLAKKDLANKSDAMQPIYWLEVPRDLHACRHADGTLCK